MVRALLVSLVLPLAASAAPVSVALDLTALDEASFEALDGVAFEKSATVRLVQEGFAVVARTADPQVVVRLALTQTPRAVVLSARGPGGSAGREVAWGSEPLVELHLELTQKLVELTRGVATPPPPSPAEPVAPPQSPRTTDAQWELLAAAGAMLRSGGADPLGVVGVRWGRGLRVAGEVSVTGGRGVGLSVVEAHVAVGPGFSVTLPAGLQLELSALLGVLLHHYAVDDSAARDPEGTHFNAVVVAPLIVSYAISSAVRLSVRLAPGWGLARTHFDGETVAWSRGAFLFEAAAGLSWSP